MISLVSHLSAGCTDSSSFNYNDLSNIDDGSCIDIILGCTDNGLLVNGAKFINDDGDLIPARIIILMQILMMVLVNQFFMDV